MRIERRSFLLLLGLTPLATGCSDDALATPSGTSSASSATGGNPDAPWRSSLYPDDWTPGKADAEGRFLHDFSYAGYHNGEPLPDAIPGKEVSVLTLGADPTGASDSTPAFLAALEAVSPAGGVVLIPPGDYRLDENLRVEASGVVLRGAGSGESRLSFTRAVDMTDRASITFAGAIEHGADLPLVEDGARLATTVHVADAADLEVGDDIAIGWVITDAFVEEHGMTGIWTAFLGTWKPVHRRTIVAIDRASAPHTLTLDVPLRYPVKTRDGGSVRRETGHLEECGLEGVSVANAIDEETAWTFDRAHAVELHRVKDAWVRDVATHAPPGQRDHLMSGGVGVFESKRVTIDACAMRKAQNRGGGGNGYLFELSASNEVLFRDCTGEEGRHNFIQNWDFGATGCVFLRCASRGGKSFTSRKGLAVTGFSEFHHSLAMANLIDDCVADDGWQGVNRGLESSGAGHSVTESVFWRLRGEGHLRSYQYGYGYVIGTSGVSVDTAGEIDPFGSFEGTGPEDFVEGVDRGDTLVPESLYEDQRLRRAARGGAQD